MRKKLSFLVIAWVVGGMALTAQAQGNPSNQQLARQERTFDGEWWLSLDSGEQSGFLNGAADCLTWVARAKWLTHSVEGLEKRIADFYKDHPESRSLPVIEVWQKLLKEIAPTKPPEGGEVWTNPHGYYNGLYWRQDSEPGNRGFLEGYLLCMRTRVESPTEIYSRSVSYYAAKINAYLKTNPKADDEPIATILSRYSDQRKPKYKPVRLFVE